MTIVELLSTLRSSEIQLWVEGEKLRYSAPPDALSSDLRAELIQHRADLLALLRQPEALPVLRWAGDEADLVPSYAQQRLWFLAELQAETRTTYNITAALRLEGELDEVALRTALVELTSRQQSLRMNFRNVEGQPVVELRPAYDPLSVVELSALPSEEQAAAVQNSVEENRCQPFDLEQDRLLRLKLLKLGPDAQVLLFSIHHIIADGWSLDVLVRELSALYAEAREGRVAELPALPIQYTDYARWQQEWLAGAELERQLAYWRAQLAEAPSLLNLPTDFARPAVKTYRGAQLECGLEPELVRQLRHLSQSKGTTLFITLLAAFKVLLWRYTGQDDLIVGSPIANRNRKETEQLIGFFVNMLALRSRLVPTQTFGELLARVREVALEAYAHQDVPFEVVVSELQPERSLGHSPLFQVVFALQNGPLEGVEFSGVEVQALAQESGTAKFDLMLNMADQGETLTGIWEYSTDLFSADTIERMAEHFGVVLRAIVANPEQPLAEISLLTEAERQQVVIEWNATAVAYPRDGSLDTLFAEQAARRPQAVAIVSGAEEVRYGELEARANRLAHYLHQRLSAQGGTNPECVIGLYLERSPEAIVALLAILKAGAAYLPLDTGYPAERVAFMLEDAEVALVVTQHSLRGQLPAREVEVICVDTEAAVIAACAAVAPVSQTTAESLAYVMYTSGSTGQPKGVCVPHRAVVRLVQNTNFVHLDASQVFLQYAPISFDAATFEIWAPLLNGAKLVIMPPEQRSLADLSAIIHSHGITTLWLTASLFNLMIDEYPHGLRGVKQLLVGGEALSVPHIGKAFAALPDCQLINGYGPTENTTFTCWYPITKRDYTPSIPIGRPIANTTVYILDEQQQPVPIGIPGELYTGGDGLAGGYLKRPELTAERFIEVAGLGRLYRTGDMCRWRADGTLEFLGRRDTQIKLRGFRIELGEIEAVLRAEEVIQDAVVVVQGEGEQRQLVAYLVPAEDELDPAELRQQLRRQLPEYMVPSQLVVLETLPLNANGKLDRSRLPEPTLSRPEFDHPFEAPHAGVEELVARIWAEVLGIERVGRHDNFFELGGHSLMAMQLLARIQTVFQSQFSLAAVFTNPTLRNMAAQVSADHHAQVADTAIARIDRHRPLPLSFAQERLWFLSQLEPDNPFYNTPLALRLRGRLDHAALQAALQDLVARHEVLRTAFRNEGGQPCQVIFEHLSVCVTEHDLSQLPTGTREETLLAHAQTEARTPFMDLATPPLLRAVLLKLSHQEHALLLTLHHIVTDGWSLSVLTRELAHFYNAHCAGESAELPPLSVQYADFAAWQRQWLKDEILEQQLDYWRRQLAGAPPMLALPTDYPRPAVQEFRGASIRFSLDHTISEALHRLGRTHNATLFMTLLSGFAVLLYRYSGQTDMVIGSPIANRQRTELEGLLGFFVNTLALRIDLGDQPRFIDLVERVQRVSLAAYVHQDLPFEKLVDELQPERDLSRSPLFQVMFALQNMPLEVAEVSGLQLSPIHVQRNAALFDLVLDFWDMPDGLHGVLEYNRDLFEQSSVERLVRHLQILLEAFAADPVAGIDSVPLLDAAEVDQLLSFSNGPTVDYAVQQSFAQAFEKQVEMTPQRVAAVAGADALTYADLNLAANRVAHLLRELGVKPNTPVGVIVPRGLDYLVAVLGIVKAGGAFVPLDTTYPAERLRYMVEDSCCSVLLATASGLARLSADGLPPTLHDVVLVSAAGMAHVSLPTEVRLHPVAALARQLADNPTVANSPSDLLYMLYTSGSTGLPKGALVRHNGALNHIFAEFRLLEFHPGTAFLQSAPASSDISVWQCLAPLLIGGRVVFADFETMCSPTALFELIRDQRVSLIELVPVVLEGLLSHTASLPEPERAMPHLEWAMVTGEAVSVALVNRWFAIWPHIPLVNAYGPTEAADDVCQHVMRAPLAQTQPSVPLGTPLDNLTVLVLDSRQQPVPIGVPGEICVSGIGVGAGYWHQPERTAAAFVNNPHTAKTFGEMLYRTGDLGRWRANGNLEFLGRLDHQVKIRGFRVELGEIEAVLNQHPYVREALVLDQQDQQGERQLVAYVQIDMDTAARAELVQQQVGLWKDLHEDSYSDTHIFERDPTFNSIGWDSTYTGQPLSHTEMQECVDNAVARILALQPQHLLEIGCGTGLLLYRLVPHCTQYYGTDLSAVAIDQLQASQQRLAIPGLDRAVLCEQRADDFSGFGPESFDTIVLNSVIQYFPSIDYLLEVIHQAVRHCAAGGALFIGDVRSLPLLRSYHTSVQCFKAEDELTCAELTQRIEAQLSREQELAVEPEFFQALRHHLASITETIIRPKRGRQHNELSRFRYDVVLQIEPPTDITPCVDEVWLDWRLHRPNLTAIRAHLETAQPPYWGLRYIANARLEAEQRMQQWLNEAAPTATVGELRQWLAQPAGPALDPEALWHLAETLPYQVEILVEPDSTSGALAVLFTHHNSPPVHIDLSDLASIPAGVTPRPWTDYANNPLQEKFSRQLVPQLRDSLKASLPGYMIPATFLVLDRFPLTPNGKIDREALPKPRFEAERGGASVAPRTDTERAVQAVWEIVLGVTEPSVTDNFFALGGHSLKATQVVSRLQQQHKTVSLRDIFTYPTIAELAALLARQQDGQALQAIPATPRAAHYPVSHAQQRLWVLAQMGGAQAYHMATSVRLQGPLTMRALHRAFSVLHQRHETLRTAFLEVDGELRQQVLDSVQPVLDFKDLSDQLEPLSTAREVALEHASSSFDLQHAPLLRVCVLKLGTADHVLLFNMHHIISDGWSLDVLIKEFMLLYAAAQDYLDYPSDQVDALQNLLLPLPIQYRDYVVWQQERLKHVGPAEGQRAYWLEQLRNLPPPLDLPTDFPRPPIKTYAGGHCRICLPSTSVRALNRLAQSQQASLFMLLVALVKVLLHRYSGETDMSIGCPVAGRDHPDLENQIGFFINTLVLRDRVDGAQPFSAFLQQVRDTATAAYAHQDYPFDQVVQDLSPPRDPSRNPLFDVMVALQNTANIALRLPELQISSLGVDYGLTQFDLLWNFTEETDGLHLDLQYNSDLFRAETTELLLKRWQILVESAIAEPETPLGRLPLLTFSERAVLVDVLPPSEYPQSAYPSLVHWFEAQVAATPQATAISDGKRRLSYAELNARANRVARHVRQHLDQTEAENNPLVGLCMHRSAELIIGLLGILKAGAAYVPLDPDAPAARLYFILKDARVSLLVTQNGVLDLPAEELPRQYWLDIQADVSSTDSYNLGLSVTPAMAAYVIYTSGSTGEPKGAVITHGNVLRLFHTTQRWFDFGPNDVWTLFHSYAFDFSVWEMWGALLYGGRLVIVPYLVSRAPEQFYALLSQEAVTVLNQTPSAFRQLLQAEAGYQQPLALRYVIFGGEALDPSQLQPWFERHGDQRPQLINMYGITETTVHVTYRPLRLDDARQSASLIGEPIPDLYLYVLDEWLEPVPPGVPGELYVGGAGLAQGYLFRDELTAERFIVDPFHPGQRLYRTGDRVRRRLDGELEYLGRLDSQVKIRGFRIEVGEITAVLGQHPGVQEATVSLRRRHGDDCLVAYYVATNGAIDPADLRRHLQQQLPAYMVPLFFVALPHLPLTLNGKLDQRALPDPEEASPSAANGSSRSPHTALERAVLEVWRKALGNDFLGPDDNVFEHGADSVLTVQARSRLQNLLEREIPVVLLFQHPTVAALAAQLEQLGRADSQSDNEQELVQQRASQRREASRQRAARRRTVQQS